MTSSLQEHLLKNFTACLPSLKPLLTLALSRSITKMRDPSGSKSNNYNSQKYASRTKGSTIDHGDSYRRLDGKLIRADSTDAQSFTAIVKPHLAAKAQYTEQQLSDRQDDIEMNRMGRDADINVATEIRVQSQSRMGNNGSSDF